MQTHTSANVCSRINVCGVNFNGNAALQIKTGLACLKESFE